MRPGIKYGTKFWQYWCLVQHSSTCKHSVIGIDNGSILGNAGFGGRHFLFCVDEETLIHLQRNEMGEFYYDTDNNETNLFQATNWSNADFDFTFLGTTTENESHLGHREINGAKNAIKLSKFLFHPVESMFQFIITSNFICNLLITLACVHRGHRPYGSSMPFLRG